MGLMDKIRGEFIDIIEWLDDSRDTIVWRFPRYQNEIKMGAKLVVRESQVAVFVNEGQIADAFGPGTYTLETRNLPILSTIKGWKYGFDSPWKAEVYFVNTRVFTDMKWGTQNPVTVRDPEFGVVRLRAFGSYAVRVADPKRLLTELVGTDPQFRTDEVAEYLRQLTVSHLGSALATAQVPMIDLAAHQQQIGQRLASVLSEELAPIGIVIPKFIIENISVPPEVEQALDKRTQMGVLGDLDQYTKFQTANAIEDAANNPGGGAGEGFGLGLGMAAGQRMAQSLNPAPAPAAGPPPLPAQAQWYLGVGGQQAGPYDQAALAAQVASGALTRTTLVWKTGMAQWVPAEQVPELAGVLGSVPPPLPPQ
ncbi:SPFH domain-containing protein [Cryptosporangium arvum]|uniref:Putative virion core protein (Lumpy skin disease virus) n=1 Tax=Cryptosporangium arvum DSM 44712 TaxID=927661 RepID=A0A010YM62_9ACTN|nr:SPFH domain-containing protein [Cryptosporangium arvum]EXG81280.1 putative virion core protein (lumpy skin disease virus) [Cryptosporangium arvum DSM 44712]